MTIPQVYGEEGDASSVFHPEQVLLNTYAQYIYLSCVVPFVTEHSTHIAQGSHDILCVLH